MLTINADQRPLFKGYHRPNDEKRIVVILPEAHTGICLLQAQRKCVFLVSARQTNLERSHCPR